MMLDLDGLKAVNDRYGHQVGDEQLRLLAATAIGAVSDRDSLYRLGGDEFALVLRSLGTAEAIGLTETIHDSVPRDVSGLTVRFSAGVAQWEPGTTKDELVRRADLALIEAKRRNQTALVYSSSFEIAVVAEPMCFGTSECLRTLSPARSTRRTRIRTATAKPSPSSVA